MLNCEDQSLSAQVVCYQISGFNCNNEPWSGLYTSSSVLSVVCSPEAPGADCWNYRGSGHCIITVDGVACDPDKNTNLSITVTPLYEGCGSAVPFACA